MEDDINQSLDEIQASRPTSIISNLVQIQKCKEPAVRNYSQTQSLSCLSVRGWKHSKAIRDELSPITLEDHNRDFAAVSYVWKASLYENARAGRYSIVRDSGEKVRAKVRDSVLDRVLAYLKYNSISVFWIDQECVNQRNKKVKNDLMQSMDIIYRRSDYPVGVLSTPLTLQADVDLLVALLDNRIVHETYPGPHLRTVASISQIHGVLDIIFRLTCDSWWSRRWIFQEEYCAELNMFLLIPHSLDLNKDEYSHIYGTIQGELTINVVDFRRQATLFCIACLHSKVFETKRDISRCRAVLRKAKRYDKLREYGSLIKYSESQFSLSTHIWADLERRFASVPSDTMAIMANCCGYATRLDVKALKRNKLRSLSLALIALLILNGEILRNDKDEVPSTALDLIKRQSFQDFNPPRKYHQLTFVKRCRLVNVVLDEEGIGSLGHLWYGEQIFRPTCLNLSALDSAESFPSTLSQIVDQLPDAYHRLAANIRDCIRGNFPSNMDTQGLQETFCDMARCIVEAVEAQRPLLLARMAGHGRALAIFVVNELDCRSTAVFTACEPADDRRSGARSRFLDKYVSLEVTVQNYRVGKARLRTKKWINGLWFADDVAPQRVVFPWPKALLGSITSA